MIGKISKGRSFSGLLAYLFEPRTKGPPEREDKQEAEKGKEEEIEHAINGRGNVERDRAGPEQETQGGRAKEDERETAAGGSRGEPRGRIIATNMAGRDARELWHEFDALASLKPEVERKVFHCAVGIPKEDLVSPEDKVRIAEKFAADMGLENTMWAAVEHDEHDHKEIHFAASLIDYDGNTISDSKDFERAEEIMRRTEEEFGLRRVEPSREAMRRCMTQQEMRFFERTGVLSTRVRLQEHVDAVIEPDLSATQFIKRLEGRGVQVIPYITDEGEVRGVSFRLEGKVMKGGDLGRGYTWPGLQKNWSKHKDVRKGKIIYEHQRDHEAISQARNRSLEQLTAEWAERNHAGESEPRRNSPTQRDDHSAARKVDRPNRKTGASHQSIYERLDHIERNLIAQQPNIAELTRQLYPHVEATVKRCEDAGQRQSKVEEQISQTEEMLAEYLLAVEDRLAKQQKESDSLFLQTQTRIVNEFRGYQQLIHADLETLRGTEASCREMVEECRRLAEQFGKPYEAASEAITKMAETARTQINETKDTALQTMDQSKAQFVKTFRKLDGALTNHPILLIGCVLLMVGMFSASVNLLMNRWMTQRMVASSIYNTQETLKPIVEKIQEQTRGLEHTYQQSENWEHYLSTLPYDQAQRLRWKVQQHVLEQKQKAAARMAKENP